MIAPFLGPPYTRRVIPEPRLVTSHVGTLAVREWTGAEGTPLVFWHALGPCGSGAELVELAPRPRFQAAVPHADVRWVDGASHGVIADAGPTLGDQIAEWISASGV